MKIKEPKVFLQSRSTTCGVACMMMVLNYYLELPLTTKVESELRKKLKLNRFDLVPVISLALYLKEQGLNIRVRHDEPRKFWDVLVGNASEDLIDQMRKRHEVAKACGVVIESGDISRDEILKQLESGPLIIGIEIFGGIKHAILLYRIENQDAVLIDPLSGRMNESLDILLGRARMDVGTWYISAFRR